MPTLLLLLLLRVARFIPVEHTVAAVRDFLAYQKTVEPLHHDRRGTLYSQVRYVAADDITLSPVRGRDVAVLSMIVMGDKNETAPPLSFALYASGMEKICAERYEGVPHWGKKNWATKDALLPFYGKDAWDAFDDVRRELDPAGVFLNEYLMDRGIGGQA